MNGGRTPEPEWVDLGLPSGLKWRRFNIGANSPEEPGLFFSWGNVEGHAIGSGYDFSQETYNGTPAASISSDLSASEDAASVILGGACRMPTSVEYEELVDNTNRLWTTYNGVPGVLLTSKSNGEVIFFPANGRYDGTAIVNPGNGFYWSKSYSGGEAAFGFNFNQNTVSPHNTNPRRYGFNIRAVLES